MRKDHNNSLTLAIALVVGISMATGTVAIAGTFGISLYGGFPWQHSAVAVASNNVEYVDTEFQDVSQVLGGRLVYMFTDPDFVGIDLTVRKHQMSLFAAEETWGTLELTPVLVGLRFQQMPEKRGRAFHGGLGLGISLNSFDKTAHLDSLEIEDPNLDLRVKTSFAMDMDFGIDYFVVPQLSLSANVEWLINYVPADGFWGEEHLFMQSTTLQFLASLTYWLR